MRALITTLVVLALLVGGAAVADGVVRERTEERLATNLQTQVPGLVGAPDVTIGGFPFLTQLLAEEFGAVRVTAPSATVDGLHLDDVDVRLEGVSTTSPTTARVAHVTAVASPASLQEALGGAVELSVGDGVLLASATVVGLSVQAELAPRPAGRAVAVDVVSVSLGGVAVDAGLIPALQGLTVPLESLPRGLTVTAVSVDAGGVHLTVEGTDLVLDAATTG